MPVLNFQQTAFAGESLLHLRMPPGSELFLPGQVQLPKARGTYELQFIILFLKLRYSISTFAVAP